MTAKKKTAPVDLLLGKLAARPDRTRCVVVAEPDHLIEWPRTLTDRKGREWVDVCGTRRAFRALSQIEDIYVVLHFAPPYGNPRGTPLARPRNLYL